MLNVTLVNRGQVGPSDAKNMTHTGMIDVAQPNNSHVLLICSLCLFYKLFLFVYFLKTYASSL